MSAWPNKFVIGLTGNIASGKSVVRRMLEHAGAFGIDADALSHRAIEKDAPGYHAVVQAFGRYILNEAGEINREKLSQIVFADSRALELLESIVHPIVFDAVDILVRKSRYRVVVIEAIKLLESPVRQACDVLWVVIASETVQLARLMNKRGMEVAQARLRLAAQSSEMEKVAQADTIIDNSGSIEETWDQVKASWTKLFPKATGSTAPIRLPGGPVTRGLMAGLQVLRARPRQAQQIVDFMATVDGRSGSPSIQDVLNAFGEKAYLLLHTPGGLRGLLGWRVENLIARVDDVRLSRDLSMDENIPFLIGEVEEASKELQCEIVLLFVPPQLAAHRDMWLALGYEERLPKELNVPAWQEAALESAPPDAIMLFKRLRTDRVLQPI